jgi:hypothetical protein
MVPSSFYNGHYMSPYKLHHHHVPVDHVLHWSFFWPDKQRIHKSKVQVRQDLVLWLAAAWVGSRSGPPAPNGFRGIKVRLTSLRELVRDFQPAVEFFFTITQLGFNLEDNFEVSTLVPKTLSPEATRVIEAEVQLMSYVPAEPPTDANVSTVYIQSNLDVEDLVQRTSSAGRGELVPQLRWLIAHGPRHEFHFMPSGRLQLRDTSVYPVMAIETWPGWLREELFGAGIDLDAAYIQFLMHWLKESFNRSEAKLKLYFPSLMRLMYDKEVYRRELCEEGLKLEYNDTNKLMIKRLIMCLANGSRISGKILVRRTEFSAATAVLLAALPDATDAQLIEVGEVLRRINDEFNSARRYVYMELNAKHPTRKAIKEVFIEYFMWEREARYALWEAIDRHGIMVHDGIDGVPAEYRARLGELMEQLDLRFSV